MANSFRTDVIIQTEDPKKEGAGTRPHTTTFDPLVLPSLYKFSSTHAFVEASGLYCIGI